eukprot:8970859-Alexandrium_andersonii.AAC.1
MQAKGCGRSLPRAAQQDPGGNESDRMTKIWCDKLEGQEVEASTPISMQFPQPTRSHGAELRRG